MAVVWNHKSSKMHEARKTFEILKNYFHCADITVSKQIPRAPGTSIQISRGGFLDLPVIIQGSLCLQWHFRLDGHRKFCRKNQALFIQPFVFGHKPSKDLMMFSLPNYCYRLSVNEVQNTVMENISLSILLSCCALFIWDSSWWRKGNQNFLWWRVQLS